MGTGTIAASGHDIGARHPRIAARNIRKSFGSVEVLRGLSLEADEGDVISMIGSSGSGKSTFLKCVNMLEVPDSGEISVDGETIRFDGAANSNGATPAQIQRLRSCLGMVFQGFNLWSHMTVLENVVMAPVAVLKVPRREATRRAEALLEQVGIASKRHCYPSALSGGQQQRVAIARALAMEPKALLLDEPTSALDPELVAEVLRVIHALAETGCTMLLVTHELRFARELSTRVLFLHNGAIVEEGSPAQIFDNPRSDACRNFVSGDFAAKGPR